MSKTDELTYEQKVAKLDEIWAGTYKSERGMGKGLVAVKKLVDDFQLDTHLGMGTTVTCVFKGER